MAPKAKLIAKEIIAKRRVRMADGGDPAAQTPDVREMLPAQQQQQQAPAQPPTSTNVVSPEGDLVSIPNEQLQAALHPVNGYRLATPDDVSAYQSQQKYGTPGQIAQTAAESAVQQATFGAVPGFGSAEDIRGRQQENPIASILGGVAPFAAEAFLPGAGEAGAATMAARAATTVPRLIGEAGEAVKTASGLSGVGAKALQYAAEGAIMQGSNEVSKALLKDPDQTVSNVIASEGLAALFGGALGVTAGGIGKVAGLWEQKFGAKAGEVAIDKTMPDIATQQLMSGVEIPPSMREALAGDQDAYNRFQVLQKSDTIGGRALQADVGSVYDQSEARTLEALGKTPAAVEKAPNEYAVGSDIQKAIEEQVKADQEVYGPIYDELKGQYKNMPVNADQKADLTGRLTKAVSDAGIGAMTGSPEAGAIKNLFASIDPIADVEGVKNLNTGINNSARNPELTRLAAVVSPVLKQFESESVINHLTNVAQGSAPKNLAQLAKVTQTALKNNDPHAAIEAAAKLEEAMSGAKAASGTDAQKAAVTLTKRKAADTAYKEAATNMNGLKQALGLGRFKGTNGFLRALDEKPPEQILARLSVKNRQEVLELLEQKFPKAAAILKDYHVNDALSSAKLPSGGLNTRKFLNKLLDTQQNPEHMQNFMMEPAVQRRLSSIKNILNSLPTDGNPSNSAAMIDKLWKGKLGTLAGGAMGVGGGHIVGGILGHAGESVLREINPFLSYKMLQMRGAGQAIVPSQVKAVFDYAKAAAEGNMAINKALGGLFANKPVFPPSKVPSDADRQRLDRYVTQVRKNPDALGNVAKDLQDQMPDHTGPLAMVATQAANYLTSIKPQSPLGLPLDTKVKPNAQQIGEYNRQLAIAQQPLMVFKHMQDGTLTPKDLATLSAVHPGAYQQYKQKVMTELATPGLQIPYKTRISMSLFLGQPIDSTMTPAGIMGAQPLPPQQQPQGGAPGNRPKRSTSSLNKGPQMYKTQGQAAEENRSRTE